MRKACGRYTFQGTQKKFQRAKPSLMLLDHIVKFIVCVRQKMILNRVGIKQTGVTMISWK